MNFATDSTARPIRVSSFPQPTVSPALWSNLLGAVCERSSSIGSLSGRNGESGHGKNLGSEAFVEKHVSDSAQ